MSAVISREASEKVSFWSVVFTLAVVVIHCTWTAETEAGRLAILLFKGTLARMAVPFFFVCSGYFLARHFGEDGWWRREVLKRIASLGIPYLVWSLALAGVLLLEAHEPLGVGGFGLNLCETPALAPLWYVRCLLIFAAVSPLFKLLSDRFGGGAVLCAYGILAVFFVLSPDCTSFWGGFFNFGFSLEGVFYFMFGIYLQRGRVDWMRRVRPQPLLAIGVLLVAARLVLAHFRVHHVPNLCFVITPLMLAGLWGCVRPRPIPAFLSSCSFPVFLMHCIVIASMRLAGGTYHACNAWAEFAAGVTVPVLFVGFVRRFAPRAAGVLFGGRV